MISRESLTSSGVALLLGLIANLVANSPWPLCFCLLVDIVSYTQGFKRSEVIWSEE